MTTDDLIEAYDRGVRDTVTGVVKTLRACAAQFAGLDGAAALLNAASQFEAGFEVAKQTAALMQAPSQGGVQ